MAFSTVVSFEAPPEIVFDVRLTYLREPQAAFTIHVAVAPLPAAGSQVDLLVEAHDQCEGVRLPRLVDEALAGVHREVGERFTAS